MFQRGYGFFFRIKEFQSQKHLKKHPGLSVIELAAPSSQDGRNASVVTTNGAEWQALRGLVDSDVSGG